ncbi:threonine/serine exporter family protein [Streptomyces sp. NPDC003832]
MERTDEVVDLDALTEFLTRPTRLLLRCIGEGAELIEHHVRTTAEALGGTAHVLLVPDSAVLTVTHHDQARTTIVRGFPEVFRLDRPTALKPLLAGLRAGCTGLAQADRSLRRIETSPAPYPWWLKLVGIVLFSVGFAPLTQPAWYEIATTAVLGTVVAVFAVAADRMPRLAKILPLLVSTTISVITIELFARDPAHGGPVLLMLPALFFFVPGDYLSAATAELAAGLITTGAIRRGPADNRPTDARAPSAPLRRTARQPPAARPDPPAAPTRPAHPWPRYGSRACAPPSTADQHHRTPRRSELRRGLKTRRPRLHHRHRNRTRSGAEHRTQPPNPLPHGLFR